MKYKRLTQKDEYGNANIKNFETQKLYENLNFDEANILTKTLNCFAELEDLIVQAENGECKSLKKDTLIWLYEMTTISQDREIKTLREKIDICKSKIDEITATHNEKVLQLKNEISQLKKEKGRLIESYSELNGSNEDEEEPEQWWQK